MSFGGKDTKAIDKDKKAAERKEKTEAQKRKHEEEKKAEEERQKTAVQDLDSFLGEDADEEEEGAVDSTYCPPATRRRLEAPSPLQIPRNILLKEEVQMSMTRNKISPQTAVDFFSAIVAASGGNIASYSLSASHIGKERNKKNRNSLEEAQKNWIPPNPAVCSTVSTLNSCFAKRSFNRSHE